MSTSPATNFYLVSQVFGPQLGEEGGEEREVGFKVLRDPTGVHHGPVYKVDKRNVRIIKAICFITYLF